MTRVKQITCDDVHDNNHDEVKHLHLMTYIKYDNRDYVKQLHLITYIMTIITELKIYI